MGKGYVSPIDSPRRARGAGRRGRQLAVLGLVLLAATGCSSDDLPNFGMPEPGTLEAKRMLHLWSTAWIAALAVGALVVGLILWTVIFHRRRSSELPTQFRYNVPIEVLYIVAPFIIIVVLFFFTARDQNQLVGPATLTGTTHTVDVVGRQWSWSFNYVDANVYEAGTPAQPPTLYLPRGEKVLFQLTSVETVHSFWVPGFLFKQDAIPGEVNEFAITPSKEGRFAGRCAELCGVDHSRMLFSVEVVSPEEFAAHMDELRAKGQTGQLPRGILPGEPIGDTRDENGSPQ